MSDEKIKLFLDSKKAQGTQEIAPPFPGLPYPIFLEHTRKIVGWGNVQLTKKGLFVSPVRITDEEVKNRITTAN